MRRRDGRPAKSVSTNPNASRPARPRAPVALNDVASSSKAPTRGRRRRRGRRSPSRRPMITSYPPIDFSFRALSTLHNLSDVPARSGKRKILKKRPDAPSVAAIETEASNSETPGAGDSLEPDDFLMSDAERERRRLARLKEKEEAENRPTYSKYYGNILRLSNNPDLVSLEGFEEAICSVLQFPFHLTSLDLSIAGLTDLPSLVDSIQNFTEISTLYLHGNGFDDIDDVESLRKMENLRVVTLHANPLDQLANHRFHILAILRWKKPGARVSGRGRIDWSSWDRLRSLDFTTVTRRDLDSAMTYESIYLKGEFRRRRKKKPITRTRFSSVEEN